MEDQTRYRIEQYLEARAGVIRTTEFQQGGLHNSYLTALTDEGRIVRIKSGLYIASESQTASGFFEVQLALPSAVVCLASALAYYELTTYEPPSVQVAIRRGDRTKPPIFPPTRQFSFGGIRHELGVVAVEVEGRTIKIYDREKTICDTVRFRRALGQDVVNEAIRNYLQGPDTKVDRVMEYSRRLRDEGPVRTHLRISV
ncbi:MAG: type IV toxin-antitoxin system AbiEi family antitoxin domain-containing protein [Spirochaetales bacterium]